MSKYPRKRLTWKMEEFLFLFWVLGIIVHTRAAGIGSCTCTIFFVPSVFQINAIWQRLEFGKAPPHQSDGFAGLLGRKGRLIRSAEQRQINEKMVYGECEVVSDTK